MPDTIECRYTKDGTESRAVYSACKKYRYSLTRIWEPEDNLLMFVMLNPSKATEVIPDRTVTMCMNRAKLPHHNFGGICVTNLFAFYSTDPQALIGIDDPIGTENYRIIEEKAQDAHTIVCAWGDGGNDERFREYVANIKAMLRQAVGNRLCYFGLTDTLRQPKHPRPLGYADDFFAWPQ